jgi:P-type conjugative transfer protein TrbG
MMRRIFAVSLFLAAASPALTQRPSLAPPQTNPNDHNMPGSKPERAPESSGILDQEKYPFAAAVKMLQAPVGLPQAAQVPSIAHAASASSAGTGGPGTLHSSYKPPILLHRDVVLSAVQQAALAEGEQAKATPTVSTIGKDGRVLFTYGVGLPTIICAPLRVCTIELEPGEKIMGEPEIGDSTRWEIVPAASGSGDLVMPILVIKPHAEGLDTNLVVTTDRRAYYLRLISKPSEYIARTAFTYKDDEDKLWQQYLQRQAERTAQEQAKATIVPLAGDSLDHLNFNYDIVGGSPSIRPIRVMDDGVKTYITMPDAARSRELPALVIESTNLKGEKGQEIVNYRVKDNIYIVDRLFDRGALLLGIGKRADRVEIRRQTPVSGGR